MAEIGVLDPGPSFRIIMRYRCHSGVRVMVAKWFNFLIDYNYLLTLDSL